MPIWRSRRPSSRPGLRVLEFFGSFGSFEGSSPPTLPRPISNTHRRVALPGELLEALNNSDGQDEPRDGRLQL